MNSSERAVADILKEYEIALNKSNINAALAPYAPDCVFMPQHSPSSTGLNAVREAYEAVFNTITLSVEFNIAEIQQIAPDWVFARTNSAGQVKVHATGLSAPEANQELFIFQKISSTWMIARYCFTTTNPPARAHG